MIAIILPTRGIVFTEVEQALEGERLFNDIHIFRSGTLKIPDAPNELIERAFVHEELMGEKYTHIWMVEEDTVPPLGSLEDLLDAKADIAYVDYGVEGISCSARNSETGEILWCGMGCTLIKREVFDAMEKPYFRTDKAFRLNDNTWIDINPEKAYGGQDIWFCINAREKGFKIEEVEGECAHLGIKELGKKGINNGLHNIYKKPEIHTYQVIGKESE